MSDYQPPPLFLDRPPQQTVASEKPWHRLLLYFKAQGLSNKECARHLETSEQYVGQITRQPWFRKQLVDLIHSQGLTGVQNLIRGAAAESVLKLIDLRDNAKKEEVQRDCARELVDRYLGKSVQVSAPEQDPLARIDERKLDAEIEELQKKLAIDPRTLGRAESLATERASQN